jgi:GAF domain
MHLLDHHPATEGGPLSVMAEADDTNTEEIAAGHDWSMCNSSDASRFREIHDAELGVAIALGVPLSSKGEVIGVFALVRYEVRPFIDKQIELITTFADQR